MIIIKHNPQTTANAVAATTAVVYLTCRALVGIFPDISFAVAQSWFHGIALSKLGSWNLTAGSFWLGLVSSTIGAWIIGYVFAIFFNALGKK